MSSRGSRKRVQQLKNVKSRYLDFEKNVKNVHTAVRRHLYAKNQGPDLQNILRQSYDYLTIMPKLRSTYDRHLIHKTSYEGRMAFLRYNSLAKS